MIGHDGIHGATVAALLRVWPSNPRRLLPPRWFTRDDAQTVMSSPCDAECDAGDYGYPAGNLPGGGACAPAFVDSRRPPPRLARRSGFIGLRARGILRLPVNSWTAIPQVEDAPPPSRLTSARPGVREQWPGDCRCEEPHQCAQDQEPDRPGEESELVRRNQLEPDDGAQPFQIAGS